MQSLTASTPCKPFRSICESFVNYCNLLLQFTGENILQIPAKREVSLSLPCRKPHAVQQKEQRRTVRGARLLPPRSFRHIYPHHAERKEPVPYAVWSGGDVKGGAVI